METDELIELLQEIKEGLNKTMEGLDDIRNAIRVYGERKRDNH